MTYGARMADDMPTAQIAGVHQIAQRVLDLDRAVSFYRDGVGLRFLGKFDPPGLAFFDLGNCRLLLEANASSAVLYLDVADITAVRTELAGRGVEFVDDPHLIHRDDEGRFGAPGTEEWMTFFRDTEDNLVGLVERRPPA